MAINYDPNRILMETFSSDEKRERSEKAIYRLLRKVVKLIFIKQAQYVHLTGSLKNIFGRFYFSGIIYQVKFKQFRIILCKY